MKKICLLICFISFVCVFDLHSQNWNTTIDENTRRINDNTNVHLSYSNRARGYWDRATDYHNKGDYSRAKEDYDRAINDLTQAIRITRDDSDLFRLFGRRGDAYFRVRNFEGAISDYTEALNYIFKLYGKSNNRIDDGIYFERGNAYYRKGDYNLAIADYEALLQKYSNSSQYSESARKNLENARKRLQGISVTESLNISHNQYPVLPSNFQQQSVAQQPQTNNNQQRSNTQSNTQQAQPRTNTQQQQPRANTQSNVIDIALNTLIQEFNNNKARTNQQYNGKIMRVSGIVEDIDNNSVNLMPPNIQFSMGIWVFFDRAERTKLLNLNKGQRITVRGVYSSNNVIPQIRSAIIE